MSDASSLGISGNSQSVGGIIKNIQSGQTVWKDSVNIAEEIAPQFGVRDSFISDGADGWYWNPVLYAAALEALFKKMVAQTSKEIVGQIVCISGGFHQHARMDFSSSAAKILARLDPAKPLTRQIAPMFTQPVFPCWMHEGAAEYAEKMGLQVAGGAKEVAKRTGSWPTPRFPAAPLKQLYEQNPQIYNALGEGSIHSGSSLFPSLLTGSVAGLDETEGSAWNLLNIRPGAWSGQWSGTMCRAIAPDLQRKLPKLLRPLAKVGTVCPYFQQRFGFSPDCTGYSFTGDNIASLLGVGVVGKGQTVLSLGTSWTLLNTSDEFTFDTDGLGHTMLAWKGGYMRMICQGNGGMTMRDFRDELGIGPSWGTFDDILANSRLNSEVISVPFKRPEPLGNRPEKVQHSALATQRKGQVAGVVSGLFANLVLSAKFIGPVKGTKVVATGGGSISPALRQFAADMLQADITQSVSTDTVALGGAIGAAIAYTETEDPREFTLRFCEYGESVSPRTGSEAEQPLVLEAFKALLES